MVVLELQPTGLADVVTEQRLEAEICELSGQIAAATARLVLMIAEYDRRQGWAEWGCRSAAHWLSWKCGVACTRHEKSCGSVTPCRRCRRSAAPSSGALKANNGANALRQQHQALGIDIEPDTIVGNHCGDKLDLAYAVSVLTRQNIPAGTRAHQPTSPLRHTHN